MYGINLDESMGGNEFEYLIADNYDPGQGDPRWLHHPHHPGPHLGGVPLHRPDAPGAPGAELADLLPVAAHDPDYKIAAGINVELYSNASKFEGGTQDQDYYCEIWIPVEKK